MKAEHIRNIIKGAHTRFITLFPALADINMYIFMSIEKSISGVATTIYLFVRLKIFCIDKIYNKFCLWTIRYSQEFFRSCFGQVISFTPNKFFKVILKVGFIIIGVHSPKYTEVFFLFAKYMTLDSVLRSHFGMNILSGKSYLKRNSTIFSTANESKHALMCMKFFL